MASPQSKTLIASSVSKYTDRPTLCARSAGDIKAWEEEMEPFEAAHLRRFPPKKSPMALNEVPMRSKAKSNIDEVEKVEERLLPLSYFAIPKRSKVPPQGKGSRGSSRILINNKKPSLQSRTEQSPKASLKSPKTPPKVEGSQISFSLVFGKMPSPVNLKHCTRRSHKTGPKVLSASEITQVAPRNTKAENDHLAPTDIDIVPAVAIQSQQVFKTSEPSGVVSQNQVMPRTDLKRMSLSDISRVVRKNTMAAGEYLAPMDIEIPLPSPVVTADYLAPMEF